MKAEIDGKGIDKRDKRSDVEKKKDEKDSDIEGDEKLEHFIRINADLKSCKDMTEEEAVEEYLSINATDLLLSEERIHKEEKDVYNI